MIFSGPHQLFALDAFARFMWVRIGCRNHQRRDIFLAICYFPPTSSLYAIHDAEDGDPFVDLQESISLFATSGDIIILGDFNACTRNLQTPIHDRGSDSICTSEIDPTRMGLQRTSDDALGLFTCCGRHLLQFCESSGLLILNGLSFFPSSNIFTC